MTTLHPLQYERRSSLTRSCFRGSRRHLPASLNSARPATRETLSDRAHLGERQLNRVFQRQQDDRQRARLCEVARNLPLFALAQSTIIRPLTVSIPHHCLTETAKRARQQRMQHFILQGIFSSSSACVLIGFSFTDFSPPGLFDHWRWQDFLFFARDSRGVAVCVNASHKRESPSAEPSPAGACGYRMGKA